VKKILEVNWFQLLYDMHLLLYFVVRNAANCVMKFVAWLYTGSHSMFAEFIHSLADTCNQVILTYCVFNCLHDCISFDNCVEIICISNVCNIYQPPYLHLFLSFCST